MLFILSVLKLKAVKRYMCHEVNLVTTSFLHFAGLRVSIPMVTMYVYFLGALVHSVG